MRWALVLILLTPTLACGHSIQAHADAGSAYLQTIPCPDRFYVRFLSWAGYPEKALPAAKKVLRFWLPHLSFTQAAETPKDVPGTGGTLWAIDIRDWRWNFASWLEVAKRDPYCRLPAASGIAADHLRSHVGIYDANELSLGSMVRADWFLRETIEGNRSPSYYDLLYSDQRFQIEVGTVKVSIQHPGGTFVWQDGGVATEVPPGKYTVEFLGATKVKRTNFPETEADFEDAFGVKEIGEFLRRKHLDARVGAIVAGNIEDPVKGSMVSRNGRVLKVLQTPFGWYSQTFDLADNSKEDFLEKAADVPFGKFEFDASEILATLPNGSLAGLLVNKQRKRIEIATTDVVHAGLVEDPKRFVDVRNPMSCIVCHAPDHGFIPPRDALKDLLRSGVDLKIYDREQYLKTRGFFGLDDPEGWNDRIDGWQRPYKALTRKTTWDPVAKKGWLGGELATAFKVARDTYDAPVTLGQAAAELGCKEDVLAAKIAKASPSARLNWAIQGQPIPRRIWEAKQYEQALRLLALP